jgi:NAD(P)-dependent dehydrogenase (short-subunit alcohol dehydrogenase family)
MIRTGNSLRACVFGASGGIGKALCEKLVVSDHVAHVYAGARSAIALHHENLSAFSFDLCDEETIAHAAREIGKGGPLDLVIVATGILQAEGLQPEKSWRDLDAKKMARAFAVNTIGPGLVAKHSLPLIPRHGRAVFAALSARVGSLEDNRLGGWHSYRASKAALNQLVRNFAIELRRKNEDAIAVALHPGTVDTALSLPFQRGLPEGQLISPELSAANLLRVIDNLVPKDNGHHIA